MSIYKSYFKKNNTIVSNSYVNTAKNPVTQLYYGKSVNKPCTYTGLSGDTCNSQTGFTSTKGNSFSRFIFDLDLSDLRSSVNDRCVILTGSSSVSHKLKMTNTSSFDPTLLNGVLADGSRRATSFKLMLWRTTGSTWDEGVGYDYSEAPGIFAPQYDQTYSLRPSNWYSATTLTGWKFNGIYNNSNSTTYTTLATQSFDNGDENIEFSGTTLINEINTLLTASTSVTSAYTYGISFIPQFEQLTGLTDTYIVGFFSRYTQTFYEPYLETIIGDTILDDRDYFYKSKSNRLFLYVNSNGVPTNLDTDPQVVVYDCDDISILSTTGTQLTCGVYYVDLTVSANTYGTPSLFTDQWSNLSIGGNSLSTVTNEFTLRSSDEYYQIGVEDTLPKKYGYSLSGIKLDEKITNSETRKVIVSVRVPYTVNETVLVDKLQYRMYVKQGTTEVDVTPWSDVNRTFNQNYFLVNAKDMIPNEYFIDLKAVSNQEVNTYRNIIKFQVVNQL